MAPPKRAKSVDGADDVDASYSPDYTGHKEVSSDDDDPVVLPGTRRQRALPHAQDQQAKRVKLSGTEKAPSVGSPLKQSPASAVTKDGLNDAQKAALSVIEAKYKKMSQPETRALAKERGYMAIKDARGKKVSSAHDAVSKWLAWFDVGFSDYERNLWVADVNDLVKIAKAGGAKFKSHKPGKQDAIKWLLQNPQELKQKVRQVIDR